MKRVALLFLFLVFFFAAFAQPANDECSGAIALSVSSDNACANAYAANISGATQSLPPCVASTYPAMDVWYKFTATASTHSFLLTPGSFTDFTIQVYSGGCGNLSSIACLDNTIISEAEGGTLTNLTPGSTYYIRIYSKYGWPNIQFNLCINTNNRPIPNDEATGAILRTSGTSGEYTHFSNLGATLSIAACTGSANNDIWFKFVATAARHIIRYSSAGYNDYPTAAQVFSGTPGNLTALKCYGLSDNALDVSGLTPGATYYYRIYISTGNAIQTDFTSFVLTPANGPINDECFGAIALPVNTDNNCTNAYNANIVGATQSLVPCVSTGNSALDVWYKFTATATTHSITLTPTSFTDFFIQVYSGSCGSLTSIACIDNTSIAEIEGGTLTNLTPGSTYYVRIYNRYGWPNLQFQLCINSNSIPIPNDEAVGAIARPTTGPEYTRFTNLGATLSLVACTGSANNDIWFKFTATSSRHVIRYNPSGNNSSYPMAAEIFSGTPGNLTSIRCYGLSDNAIDISGLTVGTTYYYRIYISNSSSAKTDFTTYITTPVSGPVNDECSGAISIPVNTDNNCTSNYTANVTGATQSLPPCINTNYSALDVWYKFTATSTTHSITLTPTSFTDFILQVYSGSCNNLTSIACIDNTIISEIEAGTLTNLTPGATYYVRVFGKYAWPDIQFQLCINSNSIPIPNDEAAGAILRPTTGPDYSHFSNLGATLSLPACTASASNDIWFKFIATSSRHILYYHTAGYNDHATAAQVFSGTPGSLTPMRCYGLSDNTTDLTGLTAGTTYYYRIYISTGNTARTDFYTYLTTPPLPLTFISFKGENRNGTNQLQWKVADEKNVSGYEVQSSIDGITFQKAGFVGAYTNGRSVNDYTFQHTTIGSNGNNLYYRLKEVDNDGKFTFSPVININGKPLPLSVYPNPVTSTVFLQVQGIKTFTYSITDVYGRNCLSGKTSSNRIETGQLSPGVYYLTLLDSETHLKKTFVLQKAAR